MKLAMSQIAWAQEEEPQVLNCLQQLGYSGVEIAPTIIAGPQPYDSPEKAQTYARGLREQYGLGVCSLQSIWYGKEGSIFGPEREFFIEYTKKAVLFAEAAGAGNLVFGCPKNRVKPEGADEELAVDFFRQVGDFAARHGTVLALEANPPVYGTNFLNRTEQAMAMAERVASKGCKVNLDFGTILINEEEIEQLNGRTGMLNHIHISEPGLALVKKHRRHQQLADLLRREKYTGYISVEMKQQPLEQVLKTAEYLAEVFG